MPTNNRSVKLEFDKKGDFSNFFHAHKEHLEKLYLGLAVTILLGTTVYWSLLASFIQGNNSDQLVSPYLFTNISTFHNAVFPSQHTFLLKWPIFWLIARLGTSLSLINATTVLLSILTVGTLAFLLYKIEKRPIVFGTICLALASVLLLVPAQPYPGGILPVNMAMITTRNIEYIIYVICVILLSYSPKLKSLAFWLSTLLLGLLIASDKLFLGLSVGSALICLVIYAVLKNSVMIKASAKWLLVSGLAWLGSTALQKLIQLKHWTNIIGGSITPYGLTQSSKDLAMGSLHAVLGLLTNMGANPAADTHIVRNIPTQIIHGLTGPGLLGYLMNCFIVIVGLLAIYKVLESSPKIKYGRSSLSNQQIMLAMIMIGSLMSAVAVFIATQHYYPVDARYLAIVVFAIFICLAIYAQTINDKLKTALLIVGLLLTLGIGGSTFRVWQLYTTQTKALADIDTRNDKIAKVLSAHNVDALVGDYWRVIPIKTDLPKQTVSPQADCSHNEPILTSKGWQLNLKTHSFAYLLTRHTGLTGYQGCSLSQIIGQYGRPNSTVTVAGTPDNPDEQILFYDEGINQTAPISSKKITTIDAIPLADLPNTECSASNTVMNIVAHQDDDLLFINPEILHYIRDGDCVRSVYLTAGDSGHGDYYWLSREKGSEAAYSMMLGTNTIWVERTVQLANRQFMKVASPKDNTSVSLIFLRLPDGSPTGGGFPDSHFESLQKLRYKNINSITSVTGFSTFKADDLINILETIMITYQPNRINTQAQDEAGKPKDHSDHISTSYFTKIAYHNYLHDRYGDQSNVPIFFYEGYPQQSRPQNVFGADLADSTKVFQAYSSYDHGVCLKNSLTCKLAPVYVRYLARDYTDPR